MRAKYGDDTAIACCVSAMPVGKQMQFFGARVNLAKTLLYAIKGGRDEVNGEQVAPAAQPVAGDVLEYDDVRARLDSMMDWLAKTYVNALNVIHYMHDKYAYERLEMALHDQRVVRTLSCGIAGLSVAADSLSAIKYATVRPVRDEDGLVVDYTIDGGVPMFGNNDDRVDLIAVDLVSSFIEKVRKFPAYGNARSTRSQCSPSPRTWSTASTPGNTPDGRRADGPFAPGADPMHGRDSKGIVASALSVAKLPYDDAEDGISLTTSIVPQALGKTPEEKIRLLSAIMDGYMRSDGFHMNVNVMNRDMLRDAMDHPDKYPQLTIRVSGYAVNFVRLTREQQKDVISRTFHMNV